MSVAGLAKDLKASSVPRLPAIAANEARCQMRLSHSMWVLFYIRAPFFKRNLEYMVPIGRADHRDMPQWRLSWPVRGKRAYFAIILMWQSPYRGDARNP